jgi:NADH dehydrogenase
MNTNPNTLSALPHVVIVGAGFGGLRAARSLAKAPVRVTLVDRNNFHLFQPLLYQVAAAGISPDEIAYPVRKIFRSQKNLEFLMAEVTGVDLEGKLLHTSGGDLHYDDLVLAVGGATTYFGMESVAQNAFGLKALQDATSIRNHLLRQFEQANQATDPAARRARLTFVVAGGGPTGVESSGAISELVRMVLAKDYPAIRAEETRVILLEAADRLLLSMPEELSQATSRALAKKGVEVRLGTAVAGFDGQAVSLKNDEVIPAHTLIWAAGVRASSLLDPLDLPKGKQGRVKVLPTLQTPARPEVFVIGDAAYLEDASGQPLPMVAQVAMQQASLAAANILRALKGEDLQPFHYNDLGSLATIGKGQAVAQIGRFKFKGLLAWWVWLAVHIMQLIGFRNRLVVLINWAWDYLFYDRAVRIIDPE